MRKRQKLRIVLEHMFSRKALGYRAFTVSWTMLAVMFWNYLYFSKLAFFESLEITLTIVIGKFIFYGIWEFFHLREVDMDGVYDVDSHERIDAVIAVRDQIGQYHDPEVDDEFPLGLA